MEKPTVFQRFIGWWMSHKSPPLTVLRGILIIVLVTWLFVVSLQTHAQEDIPRFEPAECPIDIPDNLDDVIAWHIRRILHKTDGKVHGSDGAAALLGVNPSTLRHRMRKLGIAYGRKKND